MARPRTVHLAALAAAATLASVLPSVTGAHAASGSTAPGYTAYDLAFHGGEPNIGYNPDHNAIFYAAGTRVLRLNWNDKNTLTTANVTPSFSPTTLDTILVGDQRTGRVFVSYLALACSIMAYTDDAGEGWHQSSGCGAAAAVDHQTVGVTSIHAPLPSNPTGYDGAVYYCAQDAYNGQCSVSLDGGVTFAPSVPVANTPGNLVGDPYGGACSALHGHLRGGPDGTAYLPLKGCGGVPTLNNFSNSEFFGGRPSLSVSEDNGLSWQVRLGPSGSHNPDESDPSVAVGAQGTLYYGWEDGTNPTDAVGGDKSAAVVATSPDGGKTWSTPVDVSTSLGLHNVQFPEVIVGDDDRAAFAFIATPGIGNDQDNAFRGDWRMYVATTYDGGKTWTTVDATPKNLVNKGCVHMLGLAPGTQRTDNCDFRNMLDFNDITVDKQGRVYVAYTDACADDCSAKDGINADADEMMVLRQSCGRGLYKAYDAVLAKASCNTAGTVVTTPKVTNPKPRSKPPVGQPAHLPTTGLPWGVAVGAVLALSGAALLRRRLGRA